MGYFDFGFNLKMRELLCRLRGDCYWYDDEDSKGRTRLLEVPVYKPADLTQFQNPTRQAFERLVDERSIASAREKFARKYRVFFPSLTPDEIAGLAHGPEASLLSLANEIDQKLRGVFDDFATVFFQLKAVSNDDLEEAAQRYREWLVEEQDANQGCTFVLWSVMLQHVRGLCAEYERYLTEAIIEIERELTRRKAEAQRVAAMQQAEQVALESQIQQVRSEAEEKFAAQTAIIEEQRAVIEELRRAVERLQREPKLTSEERERVEIQRKIAQIAKLEQDCKTDEEKQPEQKDSIRRAYGKKIDALKREL